MKKIVLLHLLFISLRCTCQIQSSFTYETNGTFCVTFTSNSTGNITSYWWSFGDLASSTSIVSTPTFCYQFEGCYSVELIVTDQFGNSDTSSQVVCIALPSSIFIPNTFTPNADGKNDFFFAEGVGIQQEGFQMEIYSRWGQTIFSTNNINEGWNGETSANTPAPKGPYLVAIVWYDTEHQKHIYKNTVLLLR